MLWKIIAKLGVSLGLISSLVVAKFTSLTILRSLDGHEVTMAENYGFAILHSVVWILSMLLMLVTVFVAYTVVLNTRYGVQQSLPMFIKSYLAMLNSIFFPHTKYVLSAIGIILLINLVCMTYFIQVKKNDTIVLDGDVTDDTNISRDQDGVGFAYRLVEMMYTVTFGLVLFGLLFIELMRPAQTKRT